MKFLAHLEKFPEKYSTNMKELKAEVAAKISDAELTETATKE